MGVGLTGAKRIQRGFLAAITGKSLYLWETAPQCKANLFVILYSGCKEVSQGLEIEYNLDSEQSSVD